MNQELIDTFLIKNANKLTVDEKIELQKQLQTCNDKAFAILMSHKKPTTRSNFWRRFLCVFSLPSLIASIVFIVQFCTEHHYNPWTGEFYYYYDPVWLVGAALCLILVITFVILLVYWNKKGVLAEKLQSLPKRKRLYKDYLKIIQAYQENIKITE